MSIYTDSITSTSDKSRIILPLTIHGGQSVSDPLYFGSGISLIGFFSPSAWTAARLEFDTSINGTDWSPVFTPSGVVAYATVSTSCGYSVYAPTFMTFNQVRFRSGTTASAVIQTADRTFQVVCRAIA
jgi:hypothetical protein